MSKKMKKYAIERSYVKLGNYLAEKRQEAGLSQREVSLALGYSSAQFISNFERGIAAPPLKKMKILSKMYKLPVREVVDLLIDAEREIVITALRA